MKTVFSIIVTYNGMQWIDRCVQSLERSSVKTEIFVIDNGSSDQTVFHIKQNYPSVNLTTLNQNLGFGQANNIGLKIAIAKQADYVFLINQDAWIEDNTIYKLVDAHHKQPAYGIISPVHLNGNGTDFDDHFFIYFSRSDIKKLLLAELRNYPSDATVVNAPFVNAAAWLISSACLQNTGGFDPIFFHYGEDDNYGQRVIYQGYKIGILPDAYIYHDKDRPSTAKNSAKSKNAAKDWIQFLVYACDVNDPHYVSLIIKKFIRHLISLLIALLRFNNAEIQYQYTMARNILFGFGRIKQSRLLAASKQGIPYLQ